jgi:hypothetical protein
VVREDTNHGGWLELWFVETQTTAANFQPSTFNLQLYIAV